MIKGEIIRFAIVGVLATLLHYGIYYALMNVMNVSVAYSLGYAIAFCANFFATSYFTFHSAPSWKKFIGMAGAHGTNYLLHIVLLNIFLWMGIPKAWAPAPVYMIALPVNFLLVKFVFKKKS